MVSIDGSHLSFSDVDQVSKDDEPVEIASSSIAAMQRSRAVVERLAAGDPPVYAMNTGVGLLADVRVPPEELQQLQRKVLRSHACGDRQPLPREVVRAMVLIRANFLTKGLSGIPLVLASPLLHLSTPP